MNARRVPLRSLLVFLSILFAGQFVAPAIAQDNPSSEADELLERLEQTYDETEALSARFTQTTTSSFSGEAITHSGTLLLQGDRYRVETNQQTLVTNGETTWVYTPSEDQVIVNDYVEDETAFAPSEFFYDYDDRFAVTSVETTTQDGEPHHVLRLEPKEESAFYREITLWMRDRDNLVTQLKVVDADDTEMIFELEDIEFNPSVSADTFTFSPPDGTEVVDLRS